MACAEVAAPPPDRTSFIEDDRAARGWLIVSPLAQLARLFSSSSRARKTTAVDQERVSSGDIVSNMISFVDATTLVHMGSVCKEWRTYCTMDKYWASLVQADFGLDVKELKPRPECSRRFYGMAHRTKRAQLRGGATSIQAALQAALGTRLQPAALIGALAASNRHMMQAAASLGYRFR